MSNLVAILSKQCVFNAHPGTVSCHKDFKWKCITTTNEFSFIINWGMRLISVSLFYKHTRLNTFFVKLQKSMLQATCFTLRTVLILKDWLLKDVINDLLNIFVQLHCVSYLDIKIYIIDISQQSSIKKASEIIN